MRRLILYFAILFALLIVATSCTDNTEARRFGGTETINLPPGQKLMTATWKELDLWYVTEPMDSAYVPKTKTFHESSNVGFWNGTVVFVESR
jgi:hypothetical protein